MFMTDRIKSARKTIFAYPHAAKQSQPTSTNRFIVYLRCKVDKKFHHFVTDLSWLRQNYVHVRRKKILRLSGKNMTKV